MHRSTLSTYPRVQTRKDHCCPNYTITQLPQQLPWPYINCCLALTSLFQEPITWLPLSFWTHMSDHCGCHYHCCCRCWSPGLQTNAPPTTTCQSQMLRMVEVITWCSAASTLTSALVFVLAVSTTQTNVTLSPEFLVSFQFCSGNDMKATIRKAI